MKKVIPIVFGLLVALLIMFSAKCAVDGLDEEADPVSGTGTRVPAP